MGRGSGTARLTRAVVGVAGGAAVFALCAGEARRGTVGPTEAGCFRTVNELPAAPFPAVWTVMQAGSLGGVFAAAAAAATLRQHRLAAQLLVSGSATWLGAKGVKRVVRRGRPSTTLDEYRPLGQLQSGSGYPSGHAAVVVTMATIAAPYVPGPWRPVLWVVALVTAGGRVYVGAHLPLDVVGGAAIGCAVGSGTSLCSAARHHR